MGKFNYHNWRAHERASQPPRWKRLILKTIWNTGETKIKHHYQELNLPEAWPTADTNAQRTFAKIAAGSSTGQIQYWEIWPSLGDTASGRIGDKIYCKGIWVRIAGVWQSIVNDTTMDTNASGPATLRLIFYDNSVINSGQTAEDESPPALFSSASFGHPHLCITGPLDPAVGGKIIKDVTIELWQGMMNGVGGVGEGVEIVTNQEKRYKIDKRFWIPFNKVVQFTSLADTAEHPESMEPTIRCAYFLRAQTQTVGQVVRGWTETPLFLETKCYFKDA